ncbi:MAG TPA: cupin domain-containing protein [Actinomycetota bacterium]
MQIRRVVTGHTAEGKAVVVSDGPAPRSHDFVHIPMMATTMLWATEPGEPISRDGADPTAAVRSQVPEPGGTCVVIVTFPPDSVYADPGFDPVAADAEGRLATPGIADRFEPDNPGMHWTPTVDYQIVLDGELWLELDDGALTHLRQGDVVIQNGTRHGWRNHTDRPATLAVFHVGAERV